MESVIRIMDKHLLKTWISLLLLSSSLTMGRLPDLIPDPLVTWYSTRIHHRLLSNMSCALEEGCASSSAFAIEPNTTEWFQHKRVLMVFDTIIWNIGGKTFFSPTDPSQWQWHECHDHYHSMQDFAYYDILDSHGNLAAEGHKASYCLRDSLCRIGYENNYNCEGKNDQGISVGCADFYSHKADCQYIDMTDVPPGNYTFQTHLNPLHAVPEQNYDNNVLNCQLSFDGTTAIVNVCQVDGVKIGDACELNRNCSYPRSECVDSKCGCRPGYRIYKVHSWLKICVADCDPLESFECENGGVKTCPLCLECNSPAPYRCKCRKGFTGEHCESAKEVPDKDKDKWVKTITIGKLTCEKCSCKELSKNAKLFKKACEQNTKGTYKNCSKLCEKVSPKCPKKDNKKWVKTIKIGKSTCEKCNCRKLSKNKTLFKKACKQNTNGTYKNCCNKCEKEN